MLYFSKLKKNTSDIHNKVSKYILKGIFHNRQNEHEDCKSKRVEKEYQSCNPYCCSGGTANGRRKKVRAEKSLNLQKSLTFFLSNFFPPILFSSHRTRGARTVADHSF